MQVAKKLTISQRQGYISFIDEGLFIRIYNQSAYIITELLNQQLVLSCNVIKKLDNIPIIYCAFPKSQLLKRFPQVIQTEWGYQIAGDFDLSDYDAWFELAFNRTIKKSDSHVQLKKPISEYTQLSLASINQTNTNIAAKTYTKTKQVSYQQSTKRVYLDDKQIAYIQNWQQRLYPTAVEEGFMESLKQLVNNVTLC